MVAVLEVTGRVGVRERPEGGVGVGGRVRGRRSRGQRSSGGSRRGINIRPRGGIRVTLLLLHPARRRRRIIALLPAAAILILAKSSNRQVRLREQVFEVIVELRGWAGAASREEGAGRVDGLGDFFFEGLRGEGGVGIGGGGGG